MKNGVIVQCVSIKKKPQVNGLPMTVSSVAMVTGGIGRGNLVERDTK